ncbi:MAG: MerR family transcriptional regulator [Proteobacteria bacterium]|nr:MerR family transcriptional regulator [Pseudomonadota bacterium]NOG60346.1 MerR family transcriptional regulator [Pseudomonadota bacterium]
MITDKKAENTFSLQVKDIAKAANVSTDAVRFYTKKGLLKPIRNKTNNYQMYNHADLVRVRFISKAKILGYTLNEIKQITHASEKSETPCPLVRDIIKKRIQKNKKQFDEAMALQKRMEKALRQWENMDDAIPIGDSICHLIESVT